MAVLSVAVAGMLAFGCAKPVPDPRPDPVDDALSRAAQGIQRDLGLLVELRQSQSTTAQRYRTPPRPADPRLLEPVTLNWAGPIEPALEVLAQLAGYTYRVVGKPPVQPRLITVHVRAQPLIEVIEHIGWQAGERVGVVLNSATKELRLVYVGE